MSKAEAQKMASPANGAAAGGARSESVSSVAAPPRATAQNPSENEIMVRLQRMVEVTRRFFEVEPAATKPLRRALRSYPVPAPVAWRWCRGEPDGKRWFHKEYPYGTASERRGRM